MRDFLTPLGLYSRPRQECRRPNPVSSAAGMAEPQSCTLAVTLAAQSCLPEPHSSPINQFRPENYPPSRTKHQIIDFPFGKTIHFPDKHSYFGYRFMQIWSSLRICIKWMVVISLLIPKPVAHPNPSTDFQERIPCATRKDT